MLEIGPHSELYLKRNLQDQILLRIPHGSLFLVTTKNEEMEIRSSQIRILARNANLHFHQELDKPALIHVQKGSLKIIWPAGQAEISANKKPQTFYIDRLKENLTPVSATEPIPETMESLAKEADSISP